jgi:peptidoglycan hydrolase-like protein with peptidoglycan-binding domain
MSPVTPATDQQRREAIQEAIRYLNQAAEFYSLQRQTDQARMDRTFEGITRTYTSNESIINTYLNRDAALTNSLKQAYQNALSNLLQNGSNLLHILLKDLYFRYIDRIPSWAWPDFSQTTGQAQIQRTVGLDGNNALDDVRAVQQRLVELGYLTPQEFVAERPASQPVQGGQPPQPVDIVTIPGTMNAIRRFSQAAFGRPTLIITPVQASLTFLNAPLTQPPGRVEIAADVGRGGTNNPADVRAVQQRLRAINLLSQAHFQAELVAEDAANVNENAIQNTIQAIARLHRELAGSNLWIIRPDSSEEEILNNPPRFRTQAMEFSNSVGQAQHNAPADVRLLQDRLLNLSYLAQAHFDAEVIDPANAANPAQIPDNQIPQTIAALISFQVSRGLNGSGQLIAGSETHRMLIRPGLPVARTGNLNATVGVGGGGHANINQPADVRMVQERLHELGFLSTTDFLAERADPAAVGNIGAAQLARTIDAIRNFQRLVVGRVDGNIDPGGMNQRILNDPTYGTLTTFNPEANNPQAGVAFAGVGGQPLNRIIQAVEQAEAGNRTGEVPAALINAAGVPASFGAGQMIGGTALGILRYPANNQLRNQYGLDMATLNTINDRATGTRNRYNAIYALVPAAGETEAALQARYNAYIAANGAQFNRDTGLFDQDIINMFRIAQIRRRIIAHPVPHGRQADTTVVNPADINPAVNALLANAHFLASYNALGFNRSSLQAYVRRTRSLGENLAGFITKAIFSQPGSQGIRNAMTDASGAAIGRMLIQQNYNQANAVVPAGQANRDRVVAAITAILHNADGTALNRYNNLANTLADVYVVGVLAIWDNL